MEFVAGTKAYKGEAAYTRAEALQHFRDAAGATHKPFIYLSAGVSKPRLHRDPGASRRIRHQLQRSPLRPRHLEGRHQDLRHQGAKAFEEWLNTTGVENINNVNKALEGRIAGTRR